MKTNAGFTPFHLAYRKETLLPVEIEISAVKMLEKLMGQPTDAFKERLLHLQEVKFDRLNVIEYYE